MSLIDENWTNATVDVDGNAANGEINAFGDNCPGTSSHRAKPLLIDIKNFTPNQGRRVDLDSTDIILFYEDSANITHPTIDWSVRNETYSMGIRIRTKQDDRRKSDGNRLAPSGDTFGRDRIENLYKIVRHILETNRRGWFRSAGSLEENIKHIVFGSRTESNDKRSRIFGYKINVTLKRFAVSL